LISPKRPREDGPPTKATMELDLDPLMSTVRTELERVEPRIEASIVGTGPGRWEVTIDAWKRGDCRAASDTNFEWDDAQLGRWKSALDAARFASLPARVGESQAPCGAVEVLSLVTHEGRQTVRIMGTVAGSLEERERLSRADRLWKTLRDLVPNGR
jgi:hypothetical protein